LKYDFIECIDSVHNPYNQVNISYTSTHLFAIYIEQTTLDYPIGMLYGKAGVMLQCNLSFHLTVHVNTT